MPNANISPRTPTAIPIPRPNDFVDEEDEDESSDDAYCDAGKGGVYTQGLGIVGVAGGGGGA